MQKKTTSVRLMLHRETLRSLGRAEGVDEGALQQVVGGESEIPRRSCQGCTQTGNQCCL